MQKRIFTRMAYLTEFRSDCDIRSLAKIVTEESERLCRIIDTTPSSEVREQALCELRELATTVRMVIAALESDSELFEAAEATGIKAAA